LDGELSGKLDLGKISQIVLCLSSKILIMRIIMKRWLLGIGYWVLDAGYWMISSLSLIGLIELIELTVNRSQVFELVDRAVSFSIRNPKSAFRNPKSKGWIPGMHYTGKFKAQC
jgi:hypothetical protein